MRVKKAVLLVLNNKTKGSVLSTNGVHAVLNPVKRRGIILSEGDVIQNLNPVFSDIIQGTDVISTTIFYNRSFLTDKVDEIDVINITFTKNPADSILSSDRVTLAQGLGILDNALNQEQLRKNIVKVFGDIDASVERLTLSLNKNISDSNLINEIIAKLFTKVSQDTSITGEVLGVTLSKPFLENVTNNDINVKTFGKAANDLSEFIETTILSTAKRLTETNDISDVTSLDVNKPFEDSIQILDSSALQPQKSINEIINLTELSLRAVGKSINDISDKIEQLVFDTSKILVDNPAILDTPQKTLSKVTSDFFSIIDSVIVSLLKERFAFDTASYQEFNVKSFTKGIEDLGVTFERLEFDFSSVREDDNNVLDQLSNFVTKVLGTDLVVSSDEAVKTAGKTVEDQVTVSENLVRELAKLLQEDSQKIEQLIKSISKVLSEDPSVNIDLIAKTAQKVLSDATFINDLNVLSVSKSLEDSVQAIDNIIVNIVLVLVFADLVNNISVTSLNTTKVRQDNVDFADTIERLLIQNRFINENDTQDYTEDNTYFLEDYVRSGISVKHPDKVSLEVTKEISENISYLDTITVFSSVVKLLTDAFTVSDNTLFTFDKALLELTILSDTLSRNVSSVKQDNVNLSDIPRLDTAKPFADITSLNDFILVNIALVELISDSLSYLSNTILQFNKNLEETISISDDTAKSVSNVLSESIQLLDLINIVLIEVGRFSDTFTVTTSGRLVSQNYVNGLPGYDSEEYFAEVYVDKSLVYFAENYAEESYIQSASPEYFADDYVGESRILT